MKIKLPDSSFNWITLIGATIAGISFFMIVFLFFITSIFGSGASYLGLVIYIVLPAFMVSGLILIPIGMFIKKKKGKLPEEKKFPVIDLNDIKHRNAFAIFIVGTIIFLFISAVGSYEAFHYSESVEFCGTTCHTVMKPEYVAYQNSPHARVSCVDCHVGEGADWYVRSKLSGLYQVYAVLANVYPKPIETPIKNLRPARETCEKCHWPEKFYSRKLRQQRYYLNDEENTEWDISLTMKIGPTFGALGLSEGIHWHINSNVKVEYIATDEKKLDIPWVRYTNLKTGEVKIYISEEEPIDESELVNYGVHVMDCMDCHNRPSHQYYPPAFFVNNAITAGNIPKELPEIKSVAMDILSNDFATTDSAMTFIRQEVESYYEGYNVSKELIENAVTGIQDEFNKNIFPEMKVKWDAYPNHIGHVEFEGCFRCHFDTHSTDKGEYISKDCENCHTINAQGPLDDMYFAETGQSLEFKHPVDIDEAWREMKCIECHTGLNP
ncbi:MAG: NapC/NirT family cytochrome c [Ignavibacteria bacterium]|jgi:nitrate/TMAO reductase-like tetraheme cytochrome c subunit